MANGKVHCPSRGPGRDSLYPCHCSQPYNSSSREFSALFWFLQALHACGLYGFEGLPRAQDWEGFYANLNRSFQPIARVWRQWVLKSKRSYRNIKCTAENNVCVLKKLFYFFLLVSYLNSELSLRGNMLKIRITSNYGALNCEQNTWLVRILLIVTRVFLPG